MGFLSRLAGIINKKKDKAENDSIEAEHAIIVSFDYGKTELTDLFALEDQLEKLINEKNLGEYDGNEVAVTGKDGSLYMYGPDADLLFKGIKPILETTPYIKNIKAKLRYDSMADDNALEKEIIITTK